MKKKCFCYNCENYFTVSSDTTELVEYCPFCGVPLEDGNHDEIEEEQ